MCDHPSCPIPGRLDLESRLQDLALVFPWVEALAAHYGLPEAICFSINLCLEEVLSNVVRHGYRGEHGEPITVAFEPGEGQVTFTVEDAAPHFDPTAQPEETVQVPLEQMTLGGNGIRLLRKFASSVAWEPLAPGNRLKIVFFLPPTSGRDLPSRQP